MKPYGLGATTTDYVEIVFGVNVVTLEQDKNVTVSYSAITFPPNPYHSTSKPMSHLLQYCIIYS